MEAINAVLPVTLYILGIILLIIFIVIGVKILRTMNKISNVIDDVNEKVKSLNKVFNIIDFTTDKLSFLSDKIVDSITSFIVRLFKKKEKNEEREEEDTDE